MVITIILLKTPDMKLSVTYQVGRYSL